MPAADSYCPEMVPVTGSFPYNGNWFVENADSTKDPTMATTHPPASAQQFLLQGVGWDFYERCLAEFGDRRIRLTYDRGSLEMMSPSSEHEHYRELISRLIGAFTEEMNIPIYSVGSTTWRRKRKKRGLEPDQCYYIQHEPFVRGKKKIDLSVDPPPDLAVEIEITRSALDRVGIYAAIGIPELWRFDGRKLRIGGLTSGGKYVEQQRSLGLPLLPPEVVEALLEQAGHSDETTWIRSFRKWVQENPASQPQDRSKDR